MRPPHPAAAHRRQPKGPNVFVPEGLIDSSGSTELAEVLAVYCLECARKMSPSRRDGLISLVVARLDLAYQDPRSSIIPSLTGRNAFFNASLAVNCQATIDQSLRDENIRALRLTPMGSCRTRRAHI